MLSGGKAIPSIGRRGRAPLAAALALTLFALAGLAAGNAAATSTGSGSWIVLESGRLGDQFWSVKAMRSGSGSPSGSREGRRPCLSVGAIRQIGPYNFHRSSYRQCEEISARSAANQPPLIASGVFAGHGAGPKLTAVGMIFASGVRRARITFSDGSSTVIRARRLDTDEARRAGLDGYRYAAFSVRGPWCPERLVSQSRSGRTLWEGTPEKQPC